MTERTFALCKPDCFEKRIVGRVLSRIEDEKFTIVEARLVCLTREDAARFYAEHAGKPFFEPLVAFMTSGPSLAMVLERELAVAHWREVIGASDARRAAYDTLRERHGDKTGLAIWRNVVHGSDSLAAAAREIAFFFGKRLPKHPLSDGPRLPPRDYTLPDSGVVRIYAHGGIDSRDDDGGFRTVASNPAACGHLADLLGELTNGRMPAGGVPVEE